METAFLNLGMLLVMFWALSQAQGALAAFAFPWRKKLLWGAAPTATFSLVRDVFFSVLLEPSAHANRLQAMTSQLFRLRSWRANLMWGCFAVVMIVFWLIVGSVFLRVPSVIVLAGGGVLLFGANLWRRGRELALVLLYLGLFLFVGEYFLRMNAGFLNQEIPWLLIWTTDGRGLAVFGMMMAGLLMGVFLRMEGLAFVIALLGLAAGGLSLNGALMLWAGERAGLNLILWWSAHRGAWPKGARQMALGLVLTSMAGLLVGWLALGWMRSDLGEFGALASGRLTERIESFLVLSAILEFITVLLTFVWGHFAGAKQPDDALESASLGPKWFRQGGLRTAVLKLQRAGLKGRVDEIGRLQQSFTQEEWNKVPLFVKKASDAEKVSLESTAKALDADLLSRSEFFGHQWR